MAEIKIEKKKPVWPWILVLLIVIAAIAYYLWRSQGHDLEDDFGSDDTEVRQDETGSNYQTSEDDTTHILSGINSDVEMVEFLSSISDSTRIGTDSDYTKNALLRLVERTRTTVARFGAGMDEPLENLKKARDRIEQDAGTAGFSKEIKSVGREITAALGTLQQKEFPGLSGEIEEAKSALADIASDVEASEQTKRIAQFFEEFGEALNKMQHKTEKQ
jgi:hypothetical protein